MRYLRATFRNYIGFYNGMGLNEIDIDFTRCKHNIVLITGLNGSGKSTLLFHLNLFPDGSSSFIPDKTAEKLLVLQSGEDIYNIKIISPADLKGRKTTKAYIQKNGIELNENGNVSSYKDIIFSEFELDSNYVSLSRLSSNDRGLGDKTPSERKRFVSSIIDNLEVYNSMYKTLNKKSLVYKSNINTIHTKIQNIGSKEALDTRLKQLQSREADLNSKIIETNNRIVTIQAKTSIDEDEAKKIQLATDEAGKLKKDLDSISIKLDEYFHKTKINKDNVKNTLSYDENLLNEYKSKYNESLSIFKEKSNRLNDVSQNILSLEAELSNTTTEDNISERYKQNKKSIASIEAELKSIGVPNDTNLIFEMNNLLIFCSKFIDLVDHFYDNISPKDIQFLIMNYSKSNIMNLQNEQNSILSQIEELKKDLIINQEFLSKVSVLKDRPSKCNIDKCPFIAEALGLSKNKIDYNKEIIAIEEKIKSLSDKVTEIQEEIDYQNSISPKSMELDTIKKLIEENSDILLIIYPELVKNFTSMLMDMNTFGLIRDHKKATDGLNLLKLLDSELQSNKVLEVEYKGYKEKIQLLNSSKAMLKKLKAEEIDLSNNVTELKSNIDEYNSMIERLTSKYQTELEYSQVYDSYIDIKDHYEIAQAKVEEFNVKSSKALEALSTINGLRTQIDNMSNELNPIMKDISTISGQLTLLDSYYQEYTECKDAYNMIETLKKYCSPTGGGIQTLFMQIYMSKTKDLTNQVLSMLFNGNYQLLDFIINESEFRIPFVGEGLPVDDISSGSSSQICMMSMIINLVLLHQGSSKFNIAQLDEIDGALDSHNRSQFVNILFHSMNILNIEQLFLISHSIEVDNTFADVISFKNYIDYESSIQSGNIIWDYNEECNKQKFQ